MKGLLYLLIILVPLIASCSSQHIITGEPLVYGIAPDKGQLLDRDTLDTTPPNLVTPHKGEIIALVLNTAFIKYLKETSSPHVLMYVQIFDDGTDNPETAITKVLYNERNSPAGVNLGLADRVLYGPTPFKGFPLRIKLFIVELDKEQKALASKIIDTVGTTAATTKPQAAPAIAVAVAIAKGINAMNEDDFELRFDLTLFPISTIGKASTGDPTLDRIQEPKQRHDKMVSLVSPLRTGSYAILKRELEERFSGRKNACGLEVSVLDMDYSQEYFKSSYTDSTSHAYIVEEDLRYEGGYLYRIVRKITDSQTNAELDNATVRLCAGPNRLVDFSLVNGIRQRFTDRTYVVLSVVPGLPLGLEPEALKAASERDARQLTKLLDNPSDASLSERIGPEVDAIAASLKSALEQRRVAAEATRRVGRDPSFRTSSDYALFWVQQIDPLTAADGSVGRRNAEAKNAAILEALAEIIVNLPILNPTDSGKMVALRSLTSADLETVTDTPGIFRLNDQGKAKL
ncbi:MAG: hypothetical protein K0S45_3980 [Nitrospira sp.]|jgi:hypothetical protein|nr:hypothetical protein [Nitrospira sp.]